MADIIEALANLAPVPAGGVDMIQDALATFGSRSAFAEAIAGTSDKKSSEYKAALKSVERWDRYTAGERGKDVRNPDRMRAVTRDKITRALRRAKLPPRAQFQVRGHMRGSREAARLRSFSVVLSREEIQGMLGQAAQAAALGEDEARQAQQAMNVVTGAYIGGRTQQGLPYSEVLTYESDVSVAITPQQ